MSPRQKKKAIDDFNMDPRKKIMVVGLRSGAEGLNLTVANRVIVVDPWWNKTAEQQAFGRVERIGQQKVSHLVRILSTANIDQRIAQMQVGKATEIDHALQDDGHTPVLPTDEQLRKLFTKKPLKE
ncbi:putative ATP-dependent helicase-like protein [Hapsidospora chrysogenum ATCC 11550]|uniref:Putative ATP-dependent helicase-like protein n=1 Tax=Hapsidospora chrysogenum (strain ATCC 11550 / CBS 779.69 / DSM 880 / IAM 14645 / JCM 23072 / IMI 49137) TaxID=857340 RepID=A0A086T8I9_HAPC1|nr:putative ATP-dependent helicase-like protein [Hapsidospora chrysogenum ATCC 11550]